MNSKKKRSKISFFRAVQSLKGYCPVCPVEQALERRLPYGQGQKGKVAFALLVNN